MGGIREIVARYQALHLPRRGHEPGLEDIGEVVTASHFYARPNFYNLERGGKTPASVRPKWLPGYVSPELIDGTALNFWREPDPTGWPMEADPDDPASSGDWVKVVGQTRGQRVRNEHVIGGWFRGHFESSDIWDLVVVPVEKVNPKRLEPVEDRAVFSQRQGGYLLWMQLLLSS